MIIKVNGKEFEINQPQITKTQLLFLSGFNPAKKQSVSYKVVKDGIPFLDGDTLYLHDQMFFTVDK